MDWFVKATVLVTALFVVYKMLAASNLSIHKLLEIKNRFALLFTGFIANVADTLGLGSFAVIVALNNRFKFVDEKKLPGTLNAHSILPALMQSFLFLNFVEMDPILLVLFVLSACAGGFLNGFIVSRLDKQTIRLVMSFGFVGIGLLVLANQLHLLPIGGDDVSLSLPKLLIGMPAMLLAGMLPAIGIGFYVPIQMILFFLGLSPLVAFPIMTTAGVIVQSVTAYAFVAKKEIAFEESLLLTLSGVIGVAVAVPIITYVNMETLRWLLFLIVIYNGGIMWQNYQREKPKLIDA